MPTEKVEFEGALGDMLSAKVDYPDDGEIRSWVLFAHGFSIGKDLKPVRTISKALVEDGYGMLRFDFTGLGDSGGDFSDTNFTTNCNDIRAAAKFLAENYKAPCVLIGHSFGGTASIKVADEIPSLKAIATIGSPCDTKHIVHQFSDKLSEILIEGEAEVMLAGRPFTIKEQFLDDVREQDMDEQIANLGKPLMIFHSPQDETVKIHNASHIYTHAKHPKSFVSLDGADHLLLKNPKDAEYVGHVLTAWAERYVSGC